jgi:hypothetical protein
VWLASAAATVRVNEAGVSHTRSHCGLKVLGLVYTTRSRYLKRYSKALEYEYKIKTAALDTLKRYSIIFLTLYLE